MNEEKEFGKKLVALQNGKEREIKQVYFNAINNLSAVAASLSYNGTNFNLELFPLLKSRVDLILKEMVAKLEVIVINGVDQAWELSNQKNRVFLDRRLKSAKLPPSIRKTLYDPNEQAKSAFKARVVKGLNLSQRVWNSTMTFRRELEIGLGAGISEGMPAAKMATLIKKNLNEPDRIFRRVKDSNGRLQLSKAAKEYHPGQGVYRSSYKNTLRVTRTETNMSYRSADYQRWQSQPFVVGVKIQLSDAHPRIDICDTLSGDYPKDFKWVGWHPNCICYQTPILITADEMDKYEDQILGIGKWDGNSVNSVKDPPEAFHEYLKNNKDKINGLDSTPYWVEDNPNYMDLLFQ